MSTSITTAFVNLYNEDFKHVYQRGGGILRQTCRTKDNVIGLTAYFNRIGKGTATTKARHGVITPMNQTHDAPSVTLVDFFAGDWVDRLDEAKVNMDERLALAEGGARALGRKVDDQIITALDATTQATITWTVTSKAAIRNALLSMVQALDALDVPNDGLRYGALTSKQWAFAMCVDQFQSADWVAARPYETGAPILSFKNYLGIKWCVHTGLPNAGVAGAKPFVWHRDAVGYASGKTPNNVAAFSGVPTQVMADITWHGDRFAHFINHCMSGGALLIDDTGVIEGSVDDSAALPTS